MPHAVCLLRFGQVFKMQSSFFLKEGNLDVGKKTIYDLQHNVLKKSPKKYQLPILQMKRAAFSLEFEF